MISLAAIGKPKYDMYFCNLKAYIFEVSIFIIKY